jgi:histidinol-phosphate aminotransferase
VSLNAHLFSARDFLRPAMAGAPARSAQDKRGFVNLSSNELVHEGVAAIVAAELARLDGGDVTRYPFCAAFEAEVAGWLGLDSDSLMLTPGSDAAYKMLLCCFSHGSGAVVTQAPNYEQLALYASMLGLAVRGVRYRRDEGFTPEMFSPALDSSPTTVWVSNPNGPSGWKMPLPDVARLAASCAERGHILVVDEAYADFAECSHLPLLRAHDNVVLIKSFSKGWAMAGARLAWLAASPAMIRYLRVWNAHNPISGLTIALARRLLERESEFIRARRELVAARNWLAADFPRVIPGSAALPSEANFVNLDVGSERRAATVGSALRSSGILVRVMGPETALGGCVRVTSAQLPVLEKVLAIARNALGGERPGRGTE